MSRIDTNAARAAVTPVPNGWGTFTSLLTVPDTIDRSDTGSGSSRVIRWANRTRRIHVWGFHDGDGWFTIQHSGSGMKVATMSERLWL